MNKILIKSKITICIILSALIVTKNGHASNQCQNLFHGKAAALSEQQKKISKRESLMKKWGYTIRNGTLYLNDFEIGKIKALDVKYFYEWQDKKSHTQWVKQGRYTKDEMDYTFLAEPQSFGRGYYVSLDPLDSYVYGSHLTVFDVNRQIDVIQISVNNRFTVINLKAPVLKQLREMDFGGFLTTEKTWLSIINESYLDKVIPDSKSHLGDLMKTFNKEGY